MERDKSYIIYIFLHEKRYIMYIVKYFSKNIHSNDNLVYIIGTLIQIKKIYGVNDSLSVCVLEGARKILSKCKWTTFFA